jgi:hypothetical protein
MIVLKSPIRVRVTALYASTTVDSLVTTLQPHLDFTLEGIVGERRHPPGSVKLSDSRDRGIPQGTLIRNWRMWTAVAEEELQQIAHKLGIPTLDPALLGANIVFAGCAQLTQIPRGSTIWFPSGLVLTIEGENFPCIGPGQEIAQHFPGVKASLFPKAARHLRGLVGVVYVAGHIEVGDEAEIRPPRDE